MSRRYFRITILTFIGILSLWKSETTHKFYRRLLTSTTHFFPPPNVPQSNRTILPAYLALCQVFTFHFWTIQEWIRQEAYQSTIEEYDTFEIHADVDICLDWSAPHISLLEISAALIISAYLPKIKYRHNCDGIKSNHGESATTTTTTTSWDYTTIQQVLQTVGVRPDRTILPISILKYNCKRCMLSYNPQVEVARIRPKAYHQCFVFPEEQKEPNWDLDQIPHIPSSEHPGMTPLSNLIIGLRERLYQSALEWKHNFGNVHVDNSMQRPVSSSSSSLLSSSSSTQSSPTPPNERESGIIYWIDPTTIGLEYANVLQEIPNLDSITSISILAGPLCWTAILPTGQLCHDYGISLKDYLIANIPQLEGKGYRGDHGVTFQIISSTAAAYSRMILSHILICSPRSPSCLLPAVSKRSMAIVLDEPSWMKAVDFMFIAGHHGTVKTKILPANIIPPTFTNPPDELEQHMVSSQFMNINAITDSEGYPEGITRPVIPDEITISSMTAQDILDEFAMTLERYDQNPNKYMGQLEVIPTFDDLRKALWDREPITLNQIQFSYQYPKHGLGGGDYRHGELATDVDSNRRGVSPNADYYIQASESRQESIRRIREKREKMSTSFYERLVQRNHANRLQLMMPLEEPNKVVVFEIPCLSNYPSIQDDKSFTTGDSGERSHLTMPSNSVLVVSQYGITIRDTSTGIIVAKGIEVIPNGTVYRELDGNYRIHDGDDSKSPQIHKVVPLNLDRKEYADFGNDVQKFCQKLQNRLNMINSKK